MHSGLIFDVKRYSINDGPGIRVTIFFKGCPLHCLWCHNPESISPRIQKMYMAEKCIGCKACVDACPEKACTLTPKGVVTDTSACTLCGICADVCPTRATEMSGKITDITEILEIVEKERIFFDQSGGGVTISGGEPLMQADFLITLLDALGARSIHRTVDTTGLAKTETLLEVAKRTDHFLYDLKMMDSKSHKKWTGVENSLILTNLKALAKTGVSIEIRLPLVKGVNDSRENIQQTAAFIASLAGEVKKVNLLPYHYVMAAKYQKLGEMPDLSELSEPSEKDITSIIDIFSGYGLSASVGG